MKEVAIRRYKLPPCCNAVVGIRRLLPSVATAVTSADAGWSAFPGNALLRAGGDGFLDALFVSSLGKYNVGFLSFLIHFEDFRAKLCATPAADTAIIVQYNFTSHAFLLCF